LVRSLQQGEASDLLTGRSLPSTREAPTQRFCCPALAAIASRLQRPLPLRCRMALVASSSAFASSQSLGGMASASNVKGRPSRPFRPGSKRSTRGSEKLRLCAVSTGLDPVCLGAIFGLDGIDVATRVEGVARMNRRTRTPTAASCRTQRISVPRVQ
jgi:hypothetical protein